MNRSQSLENTVTYDGLLPLDKPKGMTSHDVVQKVRRLTQQRRVGHVGTLDPLATGLLLLCLGKGGKIARFLTEYDKTYRAQLRLGVRSRTFDAEAVDSEMLQNAAVPDIPQEELDRVMERFVGVIQQRAPIYSAIKVKGRPMYRAARQGEAIEAPVRTVSIRNITVSRFETPYVDFTVDCGKGAYIRSLANDIGESLGCGAYLSQLRRTAIGKFSLATALSLEDVEKLVKTNELQERVLTPAAALDLPSLVISDAFISGVAVGRRPGPSDIERVNGQFNAGDYVSLMSQNNTALAVGIAEVDSHEIALTRKQPIYRHLRVL